MGISQVDSQAWRRASGFGVEGLPFWGGRRAFHSHRRNMGLAKPPILSLLRRGGGGGGFEHRSSLGLKLGFRAQAGCPKTPNSQEGLGSGLQGALDSPKPKPQSPKSKKLLNSSSGHRTFRFQGSASVFRVSESVELPNCLRNIGFKDLPCSITLLYCGSIRVYIYI